MKCLVLLVLTGVFAAASVTRADDAAAVPVPTVKAGGEQAPAAPKASKGNYGSPGEPITLTGTLRLTQYPQRDGSTKKVFFYGFSTADGLGAKITPASQKGLTAADLDAMLDKVVTVKAMGSYFQRDGKKVVHLSSVTSVELAPEAAKP